jgi:hypothetical protein
MYLDEIIARYAALPLTRPDGSAPADIADLETRLGFDFPAAYREYLEWAGDDSGDLFIVSECNLTFAAIAREWTQNILDENGLSDCLPADALILAMDNHRRRELLPMRSRDHDRALQAARDLFNYEVADDYPVFNEIDDWELWFITASEGDNPPVYHFIESAEPLAIKQSHARFTDWLNEALDTEVRRLQTCREFYAANANVVHPSDFLAEAKRYWDEFKSAPLQPCTPEEIFDLEKRLGFGLPPAYREFLLWMGHGAGSFWSEREGVQNAFYAKIKPYMRTRLLRMMRQDVPPGHTLLPDDAFVFWRADFGVSMFLRLSEGDDPPIYIYRGDTRDLDFEVRAPSFSAMLLDEIQRHVEFITKYGMRPI